MNNTSKIIIVLLIALLIGGSVYTFKENFERKEETIHTGFLGEARTNPLYASRLFLKRMGIPTFTQKNIKGATGLPNTDTVLLINSRRTTISYRQNEELINWVKSGGHVIALATHNWTYYRSNKDTKNPDTLPFNESDSDEIKDTESSYDDIAEKENDYDNDPLQRFLGVNTDSRLTYNDLYERDQDLIDDIERENGDYIRDTLFKIRLDGIKKDFAIMNMWYNPIRLENSKAGFSVKPEIVKHYADYFILRQPVGDGLITLMSSMEFIENKHLDQADHAELFWYLIHGNHKSIEQPEAVWLIHNDKIAPLWNILWRNVWAFILSLTALMLAWFLAKTRRFGPIIPKEDEDRRSLNEHISSSGNYYWKNNSEMQLLNSAQNALFQTLAKRYPTWGHLNKEEQIHLLHDKYTIQKKSLERSLYVDKITSTEEFTKAIRLIEFLRKETNSVNTTSPTSMINAVRQNNPVKKKEIT